MKKQKPPARRKPNRVANYENPKILNYIVESTGSLAEFKKMKRDFDRPLELQEEIDLSTLRRDANE